MHLEFLVEEESAEAALKEIVPKIIGVTATFHVHVHQGNRYCLKSFPTASEPMPSGYLQTGASSFFLTKTGKIATNSKLRWKLLPSAQV